MAFLFSSGAADTRVPDVAILEGRETPLKVTGEGAI
jgi:hypothetical protein